MPFLLPICAPRRWVGGCLLAWACAATAAPATAQLTLSALFEQAWQRQPEAQALPLHQQAAQAERASADAWTADAPALEVQTQTDRIGSRQGAREYSVGLALPLWLPGERARKAALGDAELQAVQGRNQAAQWEFAARVREAWWAWQRARSDLALAQEQLHSAQALAKDVDKRYQAGDMARADLYQAQSGVAQAQAAGAEAQAAQAAAWAVLAAWLGTPDMGSAPPEPESFPALDTTVADTHPALADWAQQAAVAQRQAELLAVQGRANPELSLSAASERGAAGERYQQSITVGLRWPLGAGVRAQAKESAALAQALQAQTRAQRERERLQADLQGALARLRASKEQQQAREQQAELARATRGFVARAFAMGEADWPTRQRAEQDAAQAERQAARARIDAAAAVSSLRQALGLLPQ